MDIQGFGYASWWNGQFAKTASSQSLANMAATGANWTTITTTWYTDSIKSAVVKATTDTESNTNVATAIATAQDQGLHVILKPHLDPASGDWRGLYAPSSPSAWFASYKSFIVEQAKLAESSGAEALVLGTELDSMATTTYRSQWADIIAAVRQVYHGEITYSAVYDKADAICFWDLLDYASVTMYPCAGSDGAVSPGQIEESWIAGDSYYSSPAESLAKLHAATDKDILITETGYRSVNGAIRDPGTYSGSGYQDIAEQLAGYRGLMAAVDGLAQNDWFKGVILWKWDPVTAPSVSYAGHYSGNDYSVQERPQALADITAWFGGSTGETNVIAGSDADDRYSGTSGNDVVAGRAGNDSLAGGAGNDRLSGGLGNDTLDGGSGSDMVSFLGEGETVTVTLGDDTTPGTATGLGTDTLRSIENAYGGDASDSLTGNGTANLLWGGNGADKLYGRGGNDTLDGSAGKDTLDGGDGSDTVSFDGALAAVTASLSSGSSSGGSGGDKFVSIENLIGSVYADTLTGSSQANRIDGGDGADKINGGTGNDTLDGGLGKDTLTGGTGSDVFAFTTVIGGGKNIDSITDFQSGDKIGLDATLFAMSSGTLAEAAFWAGTAAHDADDRIIYNKTTGALYYDADGNGTQAAVQFALIGIASHATLKAGDFLLTAP